MKQLDFCIISRKQNLRWRKHYDYAPLFHVILSLSPLVPKTKSENAASVASWSWSG